MSATAALAIEVLPERRAVEVEIVVPAYNEEAQLEASVRRLHAYLATRFPVTWVLTIVDNASLDRTWGVACRLARELDGVQALHLDEKGRGRALRAAWSASRARVVAYMDVDLSTRLDAMLPLVAPVLSGHSDVAIGSRLAADARVVRGAKREVISRTYNLLLRATLRNRFSDAQCGFKALRSDVGEALLPLAEDDGWFFDTELLVLAEHNGLRIHEVPVDWVDDPDSRVDLAGTAMTDVRGIWRLARRLAAGRSVLSAGPFRDDPAPGLAGQLARFAGIGAASTLLFAALFAGLVGPAGPVTADVVALGMCSLANLAANRRITFSRRGRTGWAHHYRAGLALAGLPLCLTLVALLALGAGGVRSVPAERAALTAANATASV